MDPVGPWSAYAASYNRLATTTGFQNGSVNGPGDFLAPHHHFTAGNASIRNQSGIVSSTSSQLLLQAAHSNGNLPGQIGLPPTGPGTSSHFNPGGFLQSNPVSYDSMFPLFHHTTAKPVHYVNQHAQALVQAQAVAVTVTKHNSSEADLCTLRENYLSSAPCSSFFEHQNTTPSITWSHQSNTQFPSPFGVLPHENMSPRSSNNKSSSIFENNFNFNFAPTHGVSTQPMNSSEYFKLSNGFLNIDKNTGRSSTPQQISSKVPPLVVVTSSSSFYNENQGAVLPDHPSAATDCSAAKNFNSSKPCSETSKPEFLNAQSCIASVGTLKVSSIPHDYRKPLLTIPSSVFPVPAPQTSTSLDNTLSISNQTIAGTVKSSNQIVQINPRNCNSSENPCNSNSSETSRASPVNYAIRDNNPKQSNLKLNYPNNKTKLLSCTKSPSVRTSVTPPNSNSNQKIQQEPYQTAVELPGKLNSSYQPSSYSHPQSEFQFTSHLKNISRDSLYSENRPFKSAQNVSSHSGTDCSVTIPQHPSHSQSQAQLHSVGHIPSCGYPIYNNSIMRLPPQSPVQHSEPSLNHCSSDTTPVNSSSQETPPLPMEASVVRALSPANQVAYLSVITQALSNSGNTKSCAADGTEYNLQKGYSSKQNCWESGVNQESNLVNPADKFLASPVYSGNSSLGGPSQLQTSLQQPGIVEKQIYCGNNADNGRLTNNINSDNVKSFPKFGNCSSQICSIESHKTTKDDSKNTNNRKKNSVSSQNSPSSSTVTEYYNRIPPPAHHNANQQAGGYFDFERWNATVPQKTVVGVSPLERNNYVNSPAHQHQPLMAPNHPLPSHFSSYPFHSGCYNEFQPSVESSQSHSNPSNLFFKNQESREELPKVIVPNIEDELGFLAENYTAEEMCRSSSMPHSKANVLSNPSSGFMASYMKFLQGERDSSPPVQNKSIRKTPWPKARQVSLTEKSVLKVELNAGGLIRTEVSSVCDPEDDPRYFPLPKSEDRHKKFPETESDSCEEEKHLPDLTLNKEQEELKFSERVRSLTGKKSLSGKLRTTSQSDNYSSNGSKQAQGPEDSDRERIVSHKKNCRSDKKRKGRSSGEPRTSKENLDHEHDPLLILPRRETSRRKAKERMNIKSFLDAEDNLDDLEEPDLGDSDSDPAWTPNKDSSDDDGIARRRNPRRVKQVAGGRKRLSTSSLVEGDEFSSSESQEAIQPPSKKMSSIRCGNKSGRGRPRTLSVVSPLLAMTAPTSSPPLGLRQTPPPPSQTEPSSFTTSESEYTFKSGEFVVMKSDLNEEHPPLWRIDGKTLLQKYEPFVENGKTLYRNISTYSGWTPQNRHIYQQVPVKFKIQNRMETVVEFLRDEIDWTDQELTEKCMKETAKYQENFDVYIQTLVSQALDSNFLTEIFQEQDDYFLSNVKTVDDVAEKRKDRLLKIAQWKSGLQDSIATWPCFNTIPLSKNQTEKLCAGCEKSQVSVRVQLYGQPYNSATLEGKKPDLEIANLKDFELCCDCVGRVELYNKISHQKYHMYIECAKRVAEKRSSDPNKDTTVILNELLADEAWLLQLFRLVRKSWAEVDRMEHAIKKKEMQASSSGDS